MSPKYCVLFSLFAINFVNLTDSLPTLTRRDPRIMGGEETEIKYHPYVVSVRYFGNHLCGGSVIGHRWILTAGHCFGQSGEVLIPFLTIRAGSSYHREGGIEIIAHNLIRHENYTLNFDNDIALIELKDSLEFSDLIQPIDLQEEPSVPGTQALALGWGFTKVGGWYSDKLRQVYLFVMSRKACQSVFGDQLTNQMMCAHDFTGGKDSCNGDSGGPLVAHGKQIGIVSAGAPGVCGDKNIPGIYAEVSTLRAWIKDNSRI